MRQVVSLVNDGQVQYALVDDDSGEFTPFAIVELPHPEKFGLHEAALLGTNLIAAIGLNGHRPRPKAVEVTQVAAHKALPPSKPKRGYNKGGSQRTIMLSEVLAVIAEYPEGLTTRQIAERIWRRDSGGVGEMPRWYLMAIGNRQTAAEEKRKTHGTPLPFRIEYRTKMSKVTGKPTGLQDKYILPLESSPPDN